MYQFINALFAVIRTIHKCEVMVDSNLTLSHSPFTERIEFKFVAQSAITLGSSFFFTSTAKHVGEQLDGSYG